MVPLIVSGGHAVRTSVDFRFSFSELRAGRSRADSANVTSMAHAMRPSHIVLLLTTKPPTQLDASLYGKEYSGDLRCVLCETDPVWKEQENALELRSLLRFVDHVAGTDICRVREHQPELLASFGGSRLPIWKRSQRRSMLRIIQLMPRPDNREILRRSLSTGSGRKIARY